MPSETWPGQIRWDLVPDTAAELSGDLSNARGALAKGELGKAERLGTSMLARLTRVTGETAPESAVTTTALRAAAEAIVGIATCGQDRPDVANTHLTAAISIFRDLIDKGYELDAASRRECITALLLTGSGDEALELTRQALEIGHEISPSVVLRVAGALRDVGRAESAVDLLRLAYSRQPDRVEISGALARGLEQAGQTGAAAHVHLEAAVLLARQGEYAASEEHFRRSLGGAPGSSAAIVGLAQVLLAQGKTKQAAETVKLGTGQEVVPPEIIAVRAEILAKTGDIAAAIEATRAGLDMFGNSSALVRTYVRLLVNAGEARDAAPWLDRVLAQDPDDSALLQAKAELLLLEDDPAGAIAILRPLVEQFPESPDYRVTLVRALVAARDEPGAFQVLQAGLSLQPDDPALLGARASVKQNLVGYAGRHLNESENPAVRAALEGALDLDPENWQAHAWLGEVLRREGEFEKALDHLDLAVRGRPDDGWIVGTRGQVLYALGRPEALDELRHGVELDDSLSWLHAQLGDAYRMVGRYREALHELTRATELAPDDAWSWALTGATQTLLGDWETARSSLNVATSLNPRYAWAFAVKAVLLQSIDELDEALATIVTALDADPQIAWAWGLKARLLDQTEGDPAEQERAARTALSAEPGDIYLHICLAEALLRRHQDKESERIFQDGIDAALASPELDKDTLQHLAWCDLRLGRFDEALDHLSALLAQDSSVSARYDLGLALLCAGRTDMAIDEYEDVAARTRSEPHVGRRRCLVRVACTDLKRLIEQGQLKSGAEVKRVQQILDQVLTPDSAPETP